jgi:hypothetical protein
MSPTMAPPITDGSADPGRLHHHHHHHSRTAAAPPPPWELALERALLSQMPRDDGDDDGPGKQSSGAGAEAEEDRSEQLDELMALAAIFGGDLSGPAADVAAREAESFGGAVQVESS